MLIAFEGLDACGKETQTTLLLDRLKLHRAAGWTPELGSIPISIRETFPRYDTDLGEAIQKYLRGQICVTKTEEDYDLAPEDPMIFQCMMTVDKYAALPDIQARLDEQQIVICDRWKASAIAFGVADGLNREWLEQIQRALPDPDLTILLSISEEETLRRRPKLRDRYEKDRNKQAIARGVYKSLCEEENWVEIHGEGSPEEVHARIWSVFVREWER